MHELVSGTAADRRLGKTLAKRKGAYRSFAVVALAPASGVRPGLWSACLIVVPEVELCRHHRGGNALLLFAYHVARGMRS